MNNNYPNRIHFLNTGSSDCILLESQGHFALVDAAEDSDYPASKPHLKYKGYEETVVSYLLNNCRGADGFVTLDFVLGTHAHSDHIGGFDTVILHPEIKVNKAYLRKYDESRVFILEYKRWDNQEVYEQMLDACKQKNVPVCFDFNGKSFKMGDFNITLSHGKVPQGLLKYGENVNSVVTVIESNGTKALLAGDMNNKVGDEKRVANEVGKINILKVGHHGYVGSSSGYFLKKLQPEFAIVPNFNKRIYPDVRFRLNHIGHSKIYCTADSNGIIADIMDNGKIVIHENIM